MAKGWAVLGDESSGELAQNNQSNRVKAERDRLQEEVEARNTENENLEKTLLQEKIAVKAMTRFVVSLAMTLNPLETKRS